MALSKILPASQEQYAGARNLIINGACAISQRGTSDTSASNGYKTTDRFRHSSAGLDNDPTHENVDVASGTTPYSLGFRKAHKITNGNQSSGAEASDTFALIYKIEAQDIANSGWDYTSSSSYITLSFWVKSSVSQSFYVRVRAMDGTSQNYAFETGVLTAGAWTKITKSIPGNSNLQFDNDNGAGLNITWDLFQGTDNTNNSVSLNQWDAFDTALRTPDQTATWYTTDDATFEITGVQLEVGETATPFEHRSFSDELTRCKRYYQKSFPYDTAPFNNAGQGGARWDERTAVMPPNSYNTSTYIGAWCHLSVPMRTTPTTTQYNTNTLGTSGSYLNDLQNSGVSTSYSILATSHNTEKLHFYVGGVHSQGNTFGVNWEADAEL